MGWCGLLSVAVVVAAAGLGAVVHVGFGGLVESFAANTFIAVQMLATPPSTTSAMSRELHAFQAFARGQRKLFQGPPPGEQTVETKRGRYKQSAAVMARVPWGVGQALPARINCAEEMHLGGIRTLRVFWPGGSRPEHSIIWAHGGGFIAGRPEQFVSFLERLSRRTGAVVYAPDYRRAPEETINSAVNDIFVIYTWLIRHRDVPSSRVVVGGDSAGGGLAAMMVQRAISHELDMPAGLVLASPWVDLSGTVGKASREANRDRDFITGGTLGWIAKVAAQGTPLDDPEVSAYYGPVEGFPPTFVSASKTEVLHDEGVAFAHKVRQGGADVMLYVPDVDLPHDWMVLSCPESVEDTAVLAHWILAQWGAFK